MEVWKKIPNFEDYEVSTMGRVRSNNKIMKLSDNGLGYFQVKLWSNRKMTRRYIHRIVMETFSPTSKKMEVNHIDHDKGNNRLDNLEWVTHKENLRKAVKFLGASAFRQREPAK